MANNYSQFSEEIGGVTPEEAAWIEKTLRRDTDDAGERKELMKELALEGEHDLDCWPCFEWEFENNKSNLWLYAEENANIDHLAWFVQAFLVKFRPTEIFKATGADYCSKLRVGEFGGWWLVISAKEILCGNTWDEATKHAEALRTGNFGPEVDT